ncbi:MAG TPA: carboxypeptidase-like regulatory domain-containing protein, partial [Gemmatimonadaceae bacterium]|nr:carboxypeptidase-like regulatory domain-containing protein [Gemmatimonadaceae bacterium]
TEKLAYLEYSLPLGVPTGRTRVLGRAMGTVTDGESGRGVPGVLVRLGSEAGVTDRAGRVYFAGLPAGEYRASLASETPISGGLYGASPAVRIDSARREVAAFRFAVSRASKVTGTVRQFATVRTALGSGADSLEYTGPVEGIMIALVSASDTLHTVTDLNGRFSFDHVSSGQWMTIVESVVPAPFRIEQPQVSVTTKPGEDTSVDFRVIPKQKPVTIMGGS